MKKNNNKNSKSKQNLNETLVELIQCNLLRIQQYSFLIEHIDQQREPELQATLESAMQDSQRFKTQLQQLLDSGEPQCNPDAVFQEIANQTGVEIAVIPQALETESMLIKSYQKALPLYPEQEQIEFLLKGHLLRIQQTLDKLEHRTSFSLD